jgi:hypothetical protein
VPILIPDLRRATLCSAGLENTDSVAARARVVGRLPRRPDNAADSREEIGRPSGTYPALLRGTMQMVCAWCREEEKSEAVKAVGKMPERQTSYTICPKCVDTFFPGLLPQDASQHATR